jgi:hypothetical protein
LRPVVLVRRPRIGNGGDRIDLSAIDAASGRTGSLSGVTFVL